MGTSILKRFSVKTVLISVIGTLAAAIVVALALGAWNSWSRLTVQSRVAAVTEASTHMFTALTSLRSDRTRTYRELLADRPSPSLDPSIREVRELDMPALRSAIAALAHVDIPDQTAVSAAITQATSRLINLHNETADALRQAKATRRPTLAKEFYDHTTTLIDQLDSLSLRLIQLVKLENAFVDQLLQIKDMAWDLRNFGGDASVMVSNTLNGQPLPADPLMKYGALVGKIETTWERLEQSSQSLPMPPRFPEVMRKARSEFFAPDYVDLRIKTLKALVAGEKPDIAPQNWSGITVPKLATLSGIADVALDVAREVAARQRSEAMFSLVLETTLLAATMLFLFAMSVLVSRRITGPLQTLQEVMLKLAGGDLSVNVKHTKRGDEIGEMARAVLVFRDAAVEKARMEREAEEERVRSEETRRKAEEEAIGRERAMVSSSIGAGLAKLAAKDLTFRLSDELPEAYAKLQNDFNDAVEQLEAALSGVRSTTESINSGTQEISSASNDLSRRTEHQAASLAETVAAIREITATVRKTAEGADQARTVVADTKEDAEKGGAVVSQAVAAMGRIEKSSQQISQIIGVIDEIAFQTNLLALNAGVEAARAGDAGRGFAVVASEVRALAQRSAEAAKEIKGLISTSTTGVAEGVKLVAESGQALERIVSKVKEINTVVSDIAASSQQQAAGLQQVNTVVNEMDQVTQQNAAMAEEATAACGLLAQTSEQLAVMVSQFQVGGSGEASIRSELKKVVPHMFRDDHKTSAAKGASSSVRARPDRVPAKLVANGMGSERHAIANSSSSDGWEEF